MSSSSDCESYTRFFELHDAAEQESSEILIKVLQRWKILDASSDLCYSDEKGCKESSDRDSNNCIENGSMGAQLILIIKWGEIEDGCDSPSLSFLSNQLDIKDRSGATALHTAVMCRNIKNAEILLKVGADANIPIEGSGLGHLVLSIGATAAYEDFSVEALKLLLEYDLKGDMKDNNGDTVVHIAARHNLAKCLQLLFEEKIDKKERENGATDEIANDKKSFDYSSLISLSNHFMMTPLLVASRYGSVDCVRILLQHHSSVDNTDIYGNTALHLAMNHGHWEIAGMLLSADPNLMGMKNANEYSPLEVATNNGQPIPSDFIPNETSQETAEKLSENQPTLIMFHPLCERHRTCPPITRVDIDTPPENHRRLEVIYGDKLGVLRAKEFRNLEWDSRPPKAQLADVLRVHDFTYVNRLENFCRLIPDIPSAIRHLDPDTTVSRYSFEAALRAAGSICKAIDKVCGKERKNRNAFCAVRPPGHHAGPRGMVTCHNDPDGSHGFCLLNNVAIGAAYARHMYRGKDGISKVAIVDFDVHHGNGTEACVRSLVPTEVKDVVKTPFCTGILKRAEIFPWLSRNDADHCLFVSVHGYGKKDNSLQEVRGGWFYPGSGESCLPPPFPHTSSSEESDDIDPENMKAAENESGSSDSSEEYAMKREPVPLILDLGLAIMKPESGRVNWRNEYRRKIFPKLVEFNPDLILVSAGFDAHRKELINFGYIGLVEEDFYWVTNQLVQIANRCCEGRIISVLEGGYSVNGGPVSAFGRSVACHVRALNEGSSSRKVWNEVEAAKEMQADDAYLAEMRRLTKEKKLQKKLRDQSLSKKRGAEAMEAHRGESQQTHSVGSTADSINSGSTNERRGEGSSEESNEEPRKRPRRAKESVDYVALAEKFKAEWNEKVDANS